MKVKTLFASLCVCFFFLSACSSQADPSEELGDGDEAGEKMTLSWFIPVDQATTVLPESDFVRETVEEKFNVALDITYMPFGEDRDNQLNVQIASGETPDMFVPTGTASQTYALDGILADMTPFLCLRKRCRITLTGSIKPNWNAMPLKTGLFGPPSRLREMYTDRTTFAKTGWTI